MPYNEDFYKKYRLYLLEPTVRKAHNLMFEQFHRFVGDVPIKALDLGCGTCEFKTYSYCQNYAGIDLYPVDDNTIVADFVKIPPKGLVKLCDDKCRNPNTFISLFATEPIVDIRLRYKLYEHLFREICTLNYGMVSGFFYNDRSYCYAVEEQGIISYQTIERQSDVMSPFFTESRTYIEVPSEMFGKDVVEVWKFFKRSSAHAMAVSVRGNGNSGSGDRVSDGSRDHPDIHSTISDSNSGRSAWAAVLYDHHSPSAEEETVESVADTVKVTLQSIGLFLAGIGCVAIGSIYGPIGMILGGVIAFLLVWIMLYGGWDIIWGAACTYGIWCRKIIPWRKGD